MYAVRLWDKRKKSRNYGISTGSPRTISYKQSPIFHYVKGANPDAGKRLPKAEPISDLSSEAGGGSKKKSKGAKNQPSATIMRGGRPDPNDLMNVDLTKGSGKKRK